MGLSMTLKRITAAAIVMAVILAGPAWFAKADTDTVTYHYDDLNRLKEVHLADTTWTEFDYDETGNRQ